MAKGGDLGPEASAVAVDDLLDALAFVGGWAAIRDELGEMDEAAALPVPRLADRSAILTPVLTADLPRDSPSRPGDVEPDAFSVLTKGCKGGVSLPAPPLPV